MAISTINTKKRKRKAVEHAITSYYNALSEQALDEDKEWAEFSLIQFLERRD
jgi:hypothetical protein